MITILRRYPDLRGPILVSHALLLTILISLLIGHDSILRVCYGTIAGISKLVELLYAAPQGVSYLIDVGLQWKVLYCNLDTLIELSSTALQETGYLGAVTFCFVDSQYTRLLNHLNDPTPVWLLDIEGFVPPPTTHQIRVPYCERPVSASA